MSPTHSYSMREVERVLQISRSTLRTLINLGFVTPTRGPRREYRFSFQDLIVLRAARTLIQAKIPRRRISRSLQDLRRRLPAAVPLSGLNISAVGDRVVVRDGKTHWHADSGQYLLGFDVSVENGVLRVVERKPERLPAQPAPQDWFNVGLQLENTDPAAALKAYQQAAAVEPDNIAARINWGRLLHERGETDAAEKVYRRALEECGTDPLTLFNLGVLLEDVGKTTAAIAAYQEAVSEDPSLADAHYNLARLYESLQQPQQALRHLGEYRRLTTATPG